MWRCMRRGVWKTFGEVQSAPPNAGRKQLLSELICVRWVVRCVEFCEMSCVSCEMSLWERTWVKWCARTRKQLHQMPHENSSWVSWVVWDDLSEMSCVRWVVWLVRWEELCELWHERSCVRRVLWVVRWVELCEMSCVSCGMSCLSCEMSCVKELGWRSVREHESSSTKCHTKAALEWVELCEMSCERWVVSDKLCDLWDERSCVKWIVLVVRWAEIREMSCVSCEMSGVVWDELCELWDELCERTWVKWCARTRKQLHQMPHESSSWVSWVVWDELWEMSCVR